MKLVRWSLLAVTISLVSSAASGAPQHGCGYRLPSQAIATWFSFGRPTNPATRVPIDQTALPWGPTGNGPLDNTLYARRYAGGDPDLAKRGGMTPQGEANERSWHTGAVLREGCRDGVFGAGWDCVPTAMEIEDYAFTVRRGTGLYQRYACLFEGNPVCPECETCPACPALVGAKPPAGLKTATDRLAAAVALSRSQRVDIGPALRSYIRQVLGYVGADHPCVPPG